MSGLISIVGILLTALSWPVVLGAQDLIPPFAPGGLIATVAIVILVNFQDKPTEQPWTLDEVRSFVFGTVSNFYLENSYRQTWLSGDAVGYYTIPLDSTYTIQLDGGGAVCDTRGIAASRAGCR